MLENMSKDSKNSFLATALASIGDGVIATDFNGKIVFANNAAEEITGWTLNEIEDKKFDEIFLLINSVTQQPMGSPIYDVLKTGKKAGLQADSTVITRNGECKYISANVSPVINEKGLVTGTITVFRDITKIRSVEIKLKQEQKNFINVFNHAPVGILVLDESTIITDVNDEALHFLKNDKASSIGKRFGDAFLCQESFLTNKGCGHSLQCKSCEIKKALHLALKSSASTTNIEFSKTFIKNNFKMEKWFKASVTPMVSDNKKSAVLVLMDITDRKNKEKELEKSRDFYLNIFENFPTMIWKGDKDGLSVYIGSGWCEFVGKSKEENLGLGWINFLHPEDVERCSNLHEAAVRKRQPYDIEYRVLHNSGQYRWIQAINRPFYDRNGNYDGYIGIGFEITDRKTAEEGLNRYKILSEAVKDVIHFIDTEGNIIDVNQAGLELYGYTYEEFIKLNIRDLRAQGVITNELLQRCEKEGATYETLHIRKDGSTFPVEISAKGAEIGGKRLIVSIIRDITQRKVVESSMKSAKEAAETANKTKSEFLANMSHEIRTPINGIVGMVELTLLTELNNEQKENLMIIKSCANTLLKVINDILDFSKMEAGKLTIENINFDIKTLVEETVKAHSANALTKGIELNYAFSSTIPQYVVGDPSRLQQILNNLISNAIKFTEIGEVWIKVKKVRTQEEEVEIQFTVEDSGIGIAEENLEKLFESFSQVDGSITRRFGGTGLGLAISKQLSEMMGGSLKVESKKGLGSKFSLTLKFKIGSKIKVQTVEVYQPKKVERQYKVLLTEDDEVNRMIISRIIKERGYFVDTACNGLEAVEKCGKNSYDIILMDIQMPVMDGIEAAKRIREKNRIVPIIAITAYALKDDRERFLSQGMDEYVSKPIKVEELFKAIEKCLSLNKYNEEISGVGICLDEVGGIVLKQKETQPFDKKDLSILNELARTLDSLNNELYKGEFSLIEPLSHKIKELANEIGIEELKTIAFKMELAARRGNTEQLIEKAKKASNIFEVFKKSIF